MKTRYFLTLGLLFAVIVANAQSFRPFFPANKSTEQVNTLMRTGNSVTSSTCPTNPVTLNGQDSATGTAIANGATHACNSNAFYVYPNNGGSTTNINSPCIETVYSTYYTSQATHGSETFYEGGANIGCVGPASPCSFPIGGTIPPISGLQGWDLFLSYLDPSLQHDFVFCRNGTITNNPVTVQLVDCWSGTALSPATTYNNTNPPNTTTCFTLTVPAGTAIGSYSFSILPVSASPALSDQGYGLAVVNPKVLSAGTYTVTYTFTPPASSGCGSVTGTYVFTIGPNPTVAVNSPAMCSGGAGTTLTASGANTYSWTPSTGLSATSGASVTANPPGTTIYTVTGTVGGCTSTASSTVTINPTPTVTAVSTPTAICTGQSAILTGGGATTYTWSANAGSATTSTVSVSPATSNVYTVTGTSLNCSNTATVAVTVNPLPTVTAVATPTTICAGSSALLTGGGATTYTWSANAGSATTNTVSVSPAGSATYTVTGTDANSCVNSATVSVNVTPTPTLVASAKTDSICAGQLDTCIVTGATTYTWMPGGLNTNTISVNPAGTTIYTVTGNNSGCTATATVVVNVKALPSLTVTATPVAICTGASSTLSATGATTYTWSANAGSVNTSTATVSPTVNSTYTVSASKNGCSNSATVAVSVGPPPTVSVTATQTTICAGNSTTLTGAGAGTYTWMPGGSTTNPLTVSPTVTTTYSVMGSSGGCKDSATITIHVNPGPAVTAVASQTAICSGQSSTLTASGAPNYTWSANAGSATTSTVTVSPSSTATYVVTGDSSGCQTSYSVVVNVTPTPTVLVIAPTTTLCSGGSLPILAGGSATTFTWSANAGSATTSTVIVSPTVTTTYSVVGATGSCTGSGSVTINVTTTPTVIASSPAPVCQGQSATMVATVSPTTSTLLWSPGGTTNDSLTVSLSTTTNYSVIASNGACSDTAYATVTINPTPTLSISSPSTQTACAGTNVTGINFTSSTGAVVGWSNSNTNIGLVSNGTGNIAGYTAPGVTSQQSGVITVAAANPVTSCASVPQTFTITINPSPNLSGTASVDSALCGKPNGAVKNLTASGGTSPLTYQWYLSSVPVPGATSANLTGVPIGVYSLIVTDASGCSVTSFTYSVPGSPAVAAAFSANTYHGTASLNVTFTNGSTGASAYSWNFGTGSLSSAQNPTFTYNTGGTYQVILTASHGTCSDTAMRTIIVDQPIEVTVPNIFSPNGDNINDEFFIVTSGVTELNCEIFNRWGQKVFTLSSPTQKWDGKLNNGNTATEGTYYYMLNAKSYDGKQHILQGPITLVK